MRIAPLALVVCLGLAGVASATTVPQYSQVRHDFPGIDDAVAAMPDSDFTGTINRLSELYRRKVVVDSAPGAAYAGALPENFIRNLDGTLADLAADLKEDDLASLTDEQVGWVLRVVQVYAWKPTVAIYQGNDFTYCGVIVPCVPSPEHPCPPACFDDDPGVFNRIDAVIGVVQGSYQRVRASSGATSAPATLNGNNLGTAIDALSLVLGVESIDD